MKIQAIQTGWVRIKTAQVEGRGPVRMLSVFADRNWTDWLPTYAWLIEHKDGLIVCALNGRSASETGERDTPTGVLVALTHPNLPPVRDGITAGLAP